MACDLETAIDACQQVGGPCSSCCCTPTCIMQLGPTRPYAGCALQQANSLQGERFTPRTASPDSKTSIMHAPACRVNPRRQQLAVSRSSSRLLDSPAWMQPGACSSGCRLKTLSARRCVERWHQGQGRQSPLYLCRLQSDGVQTHVEPTVVPAALFACRSCNASTSTLTPSLSQLTSPNSPSALPSTARYCRAPLQHGPTTCSRRWQDSRHSLSQTGRHGCHCLRPRKQQCLLMRPQLPTGWVLWLDLRRSPKRSSRVCLNQCRHRGKTRLMISQC